MAECRQCGNDIIWATDEETGDRLPVDRNAMELRGTDRFFFLSHDPPMVRRVIHEHAGYAYGDHRVTCPVRQAARVG